MENIEVMDIMNEEATAIEAVTETEEVLATEAEINETNESEPEVPTSGRYPWGDGVMKKFGVAFACGALSAVGAAVANEIIIPGVKKLGRKAIDAIKTRVERKKAEKAAAKDVIDETDEA